MAGSAAVDEEQVFQASLRPQLLAEYIGQSQVKENLKISIEAAKSRGECLDHALLLGPPGLGKTTLAMIIANEMGVSIRATSGPVLERAGDLAGILTNLREHEVLFVDEIHRLNKTVEEMLYPAMEDRAIDILIGSGPGARSVKVGLPAFTLIGATTRAGLLTAPMRSRFGIQHRLDVYKVEELATIATRSAALLKVPIDADAATEIAGRARGTPRIANRLLKRVRDYAQVKGDGRITLDVAREALARLGVDALGLDEMDLRILRTIIEKFDGGPVGIGTISAAVSEERDALEDIYEPYLLHIGFLDRTPRGRLATRLAYEHLGYKQRPGVQASLF
ncbi:MAG: Holliday junction branch migration DNA helicase RuvB [Acidobacteriota bacterium]